MKRFWPQTAAEWVALVSGILSLPVLLAGALGAFRTEPALRVVFLIVGVALLVFAIVVLVRKAVIARRDRGKVIVLLADFDGAGGKGVTTRIANKLGRELAQFPDARLVMLRSCISEGTPRGELERLGKKRHAAILIWGDCDRSETTGIVATHFELLSRPHGMPQLRPELHGEPRKVSLADLNSFTLHSQLADEMAGMCLFTLGLTRYAAGNWTDAARRFSAALDALGQAARPEDVAVFLFYQGNAHSYLAEVRDPAENAQAAITAYSEALKVYTLERFPTQYAMTQNNLGIAYRTLAEVKDKPENCREAIAACSEALKVYTLERFPMQYATTQNNLGNAYCTLAEVEDKPENCRRAEEAFRRALEVYRGLNLTEMVRQVEHNLALLRRFCGN